MKEEKFHRHMGIYGICKNENKVLVVKKTGGPYRNRFDLPGGTIEQNESLVQAIHREFDEETGMQINVSGNVGTVEYIVQYGFRGNTHIQHIAIFVEVIIETENSVIDGLSDDTSGISWVDIDKINESNSSPLVLTAKEYIEKNKLEGLSHRFNDWEVRADKVWE